MKINLLSLAPDSFILGPSNLLNQFYPKKVFDLSCIKNISTNFVSTEDCAFNQASNPWGLEIHLTSKCQLSCTRCSYGQRNRDHSELSFKVLEQILDVAN